MWCSRLVTVALLFTPALPATALLSGTVDASYLFPDSGFDLMLQGGGVTIQARGIANPGGGSAQALCTAWCGFGAMVRAFDGNFASIDGITSPYFQFSLNENGASGDFTGQLVLFAPNTSQVIASRSLESLLGNVVTRQAMPNYAETWSSFTGGTATAGAVATPEPASWGICWIGLLVLLCKGREGGRKAAPLGQRTP